MKKVIFNIKKSILFALPFILFLILTISSGQSFGQDSINNPVIQKEIKPVENKPKKDSTSGFKLSNIFEADTTGNSANNKDNLNPLPVQDIISTEKIFWSIVFILVGYFMIKLLLGILTTIAKRSPRYEFGIKRIIPILRILFWSLVVYIIIKGIFRPPAATIFAFLASVGVAIGFSAQDLLKNVFGGLVVMFDRPFQVGDKIEAGDYYGEVTHIGIRSTRIVTPDDSVVTIPNSEFMNQYVSNSNSGENNCQVVAEIYLPIDIDTEKVREIATEAAHISKYIFLPKPVVVLFFNEIKDRRTVLKMRLKAYVSDLSKEFYFKSEMTEIVLKTLIEKKIIPEDFYKN